MGIILLLLFGLAIFSLFVAIGTYIVKRIYLRSMGRKLTVIKSVTIAGNTTTFETGWTYNEKTQLWEPPDYAKKESDKKWKWDSDKKIWVDQEKEKRLAKYKEYHKDRPPTFEEWKAAREKENQDKA